MTTTDPTPASMGGPLSEAERPRNQHCMNCGDTRGGPMGHETQECTYDSLPDKASYTSGSKLMAAVERHNERLSPEDRAAVQSHAARILDHEARVDALAAAIGRPRVKPVPTTDRLAERYSLDEIRAYLAGPPAVADSAHRGDVDRMAWLLELHDTVRDRLHAVADENARLQERLDTAEGRLAAVAKVADRIAPHAENMCRLGDLEIGVPLRNAVRDIRGAITKETR